MNKKKILLVAIKRGKKLHRKDTLQAANWASRVLGPDPSNPACSTGGLDFPSSFLITLSYAFSMVFSNNASLQTADPRAAASIAKQSFGELTILIPQIFKNVVKMGIWKAEMNVDF